MPFRLPSKSRKQRPAALPIEITSLFTPAEIICAPAEVELDAALRRLIGRVRAADVSIDAGSVYRLIIARDRCGVMAVTSRAAVIHARIEGLQRRRIAVALSRGGIHCRDDDDTPACAGAEIGRVNLLALILAPVDDPAGYLRLVAALRGLCCAEGGIERLLQLDDPQQIWSAFRAANEHLPDYVAARDMMRTDFPRLRDTDTLAEAIDTFCREGVIELPVLDADGDLVGLVTQDELIRVCLPEYITWMEDLSPILNFEPFVEVLRRESQMPVQEIMVFGERYATVEETTPAVQVAKVMMRRDVRHVMVVRDKKLVGIITIQEFIQRVLRA